MKKLEMTDRLLTGIADIDAQHRELIARCNRALVEKDVWQDEALFKETLGFIAGYVEYHFTAEEIAMRRHKFEGLEHHRTQHQFLRAEIAEIKRVVLVSGAGKEVRARLSFLLMDWLTYHIGHVDMKMAGFFKTRGRGTALVLPSHRELREMGLDPGAMPSIEVIKPSRPPIRPKKTSA